MPAFEFRISNSRSKVLTFYLEPWGGKYTVRCDGVLRVVIESPSPPVLEWEVTEDAQALVVHDPPDALATVYEGDHQVRAD